MSTRPLINLKDVTLEYETHHDRTNSLKEFVINTITRRKYVEQKISRIKALNAVNLEVFEGERIGIIGLNGSGKSTTLKVISGILKPTQGSVEVVGSVQPLIEIGAGFDPEFTGRENIYLNGYMLGFNKKQLQEKEQEIIDFTELGHFIDTPVKYYSSGMTVRLAFTIATIIKPEILIIDEMLAAGDLSFIQKATNRLEKLIDESRALAIVSHDLSIIKKLCTRVIVAKRGSFVFDGKPDEAIDFYQRDFAIPN